MNQPPLDIDVHTQDSLEASYEEALLKAKGAQSQNIDKKTSYHKATSYPSYIEAGSLHAKRWMQTHERTKLVSILLICRRSRF